MNEGEGINVMTYFLNEYIRKYKDIPYDRDLVNALKEGLQFDNFT